MSSGAPLAGVALLPSPNPRSSPSSRSSPPSSGPRSSSVDEGLPIFGGGDDARSGGGAGRQESVGASPVSVRKASALRLAAGRAPAGMRAGAGLTVAGNGVERAGPVSAPSEGW